jgi:hypothetical protein
MYLYQIMLVKYLKIPRQMNDEDENKEVVASPCSKSLLITPVPSSPVPKTNSKTVLRYIKQKYLNASRRKKDMHLQRNLAVQSKKAEAEVCWSHLKRMIADYEYLIMLEKYNIILDIGCTLFQHYTSSEDVTALSVVVLHFVMKCCYIFSVFISRQAF